MYREDNPRMRVTRHLYAEKEEDDKHFERDAATGARGNWDASC
jgi:hypothetical protein